MKIPFAEICF